MARIVEPNVHLVFPYLLGHKWNVRGRDAAELLDLYLVHTDKTYEQCYEDLRTMDYEQAQELVEKVCNS